MREFIFVDNETNNFFRCKLKSVQCQGTNQQGGRCMRKVVSSLPLCHWHLESMKQLQIKKSLLPNVGVGLFAYNRRKEANEIIFKPRDIIINYTGEVLDDNELERRYVDKTAVYGVQLGEDTNVDAACQRGIAASANHKAQKQSNADLASKIINGQRTAVIVAKKRIRNGEEIYINYGKNYRFNEPVDHVTTKY